MKSVFELGGKAINKDTAMAMSGGTNYEPAYKEKEKFVLFKIKPVMPDKPTNAPQIQQQEKDLSGSVEVGLWLLAGLVLVENGFADVIAVITRLEKYHFLKSLM